MKLPIAVAGILAGAVIGTAGLLLYPFAGLLSPLAGAVIGGCAGGVVGILTLKHSITSYQRNVRPGLAAYRLTAYFGVLAAIISGGILGLIITIWGLSILYGRINVIQMLAGIVFGALLCGFSAGIYVRRYIKELKKIQYAKYLASVPENAGDFIQSIIGKMRYKQKVRHDVMAELAAHFEDELRDCKTDEEKEQKAQQLIEQFGDVKLLGILLRRAKKRCRPLWQTVVARTFQGIGVLILFFVLHCVYISLAKPNININYIEQATRLVRPITNESLNAAPIYQKAMDAYKRQPSVEDKAGMGRTGLFLFEDEEYKDMNDGEIGLLDAIREKNWITELTEEEITLLKQWLSDNADTLEFFKQASEKPNYWPKREAKDNYLLGISLSELPQLHKLAKTMAWQAKLKAYDEDIEGAFDDLLACYRTARHLKGPRMLVEQLTAMSIQDNSTSSALAILDNQQVNSQSLKKFQVQLEKLMAEDTYIIYCGWDRLFALDFIQRCYTDNKRGSGYMIPEHVRKFMNELQGVGFAELDSFWICLGVSIITANRHQLVSEYDKIYDTLERYAKQTPWQLHKQNIDFALELENWSYLKKIRYWPVYVFMQSFNGPHEAGYYNKVQVDALITTLAVIRFKQSTGDYPENLDDLVAAGYLKSLPMDPFSDKPVVYKTTDDGFMLYSVGYNFKDDGGQVYRYEDGEPRLRDDEFGDAVFWPVQKPERKQP